MLWVLKRTVLMRCFFQAPKTHMFRLMYTGMSLERGHLWRDVRYSAGLTWIRFFSSEI